MPLTDTSIGVTEFQSSDFTIWINFRLFFMCMGEGNGIPCEEDGIPAWIHHYKESIHIYRIQECDRLLFAGDDQV
jgi:hypothetical protein